MQQLQHTKKKRQMKASETLAKTPEKHLKIITNIYKIKMKHLQTYI
jgi:hypothetical protein